MNVHDRIHLYATPRTKATIAHAGGRTSDWVNNAIVRYADMVQDEKPRLARLFTQAQAQEIVAYTTDVAYDHHTVAMLVQAHTRDQYLAELMRELTLPQRCTLAEVCERYHRLRVQDEDVQPTIEYLFA